MNDTAKTAISRNRPNAMAFGVMADPESPAVDTEPSVQTETITAQLRTAIREGHFSPNERLVEKELADKFKVNRAKIRMALVILGQEDLVVIEPHRGARVRVMTGREALEIAETRGALEGMLAALAAQRATPADRVRLCELQDAMSTCVNSGDLLKYSEINGDLHATIHAMSGNGTAQKLLASLKSRIVRLQFRAILKPGRPARSLDEHLQIVDAICAGDPERADRAMRTHLSNARNSLQQIIEESKPSMFA
ncbi:MAG: GntR family transcriptional regulator [Pseudolabrys sp.]|nr:GntR family transcriptional regulator [Pseudolabrys sp.]